MWFNILKLNLKTLQNPKTDTAANPINIRENNKCRDKIRKFERNLYDEFDKDHWANRGLMHKGIPEKVYCWMVENLDKFFNAPFEDYSIPNQSKIIHDTLTDGDELFHIKIYSKRWESGRPFFFSLLGPMEIAPYDNGEITMYFLPTYSREENIETYEKIKSCWERA